MRRVVFRCLIVLLLGTVGLTAWIGWRIVAFDASDFEGNHDCAIILGAAVAKGQPSPVFQARIDHAVELFHRGIVSRLIFTGGVGKGEAIAEGDAGGDYARVKGVPASAILVERKSRTTLQNLQGSKEIMENEGLSSALIVSDPLHLRRSVMMARWLGIACAPAATPNTRYKTWKTKLPFLFREIYFSIHFKLFRQ